VFVTLSPGLLGRREEAGAQLRTLAHCHDEPGHDGSAGVHVIYEIRDETVVPGKPVRRQ
jgi:hypothetical protein